MLETIPGGVLLNSEISAIVEGKARHNGFALRTPTIIESHDFALQIFSAVNFIWNWWLEKIQN